MAEPFDGDDVSTGAFPDVSIDVFINDRMMSRPARSPRLELEVQAFHRLIQAFSSDSQALLHETVQTACELCNADAAAVTLVETLPDGTETVRWVAATGTLRALTGKTMPRSDSPCGWVLDQGAPQLFCRPRRVYSCLEGAPEIAEALLVPWTGENTSGTLWAVSNTETGRFDPEDLRLLQSLTTFASAALAKNQSDASRIARESIGSAARVANQLAHAMNNPLQALSNTLFLVENGRWEHLHDARMQVERLSGLVRGILELNARPAAGAAPAERLPVVEGSLKLKAQPSPPNAPL